MNNILSEFKKVCSYSELKEKVGKKFFVDDVEIAIFKVENEIFAVSNICPHQKTHLIHEGLVENCKVICPVHGWEFDLKTGQLPSNRKGLNTYEVEVINDNVYVKAKKDEYKW
ncbi:nitrite reductase small subunit NirD [Melioribacteraceae bacterium 4301-Me]|uniref:nitrite reductase small subunit NirD n=1 Tax=Pyranulibacter aquaticus TaxID=3163344 RepID=UPI0035959AD9